MKDEEITAATETTPNYRQILEMIEENKRLKIENERLSKRLENAVVLPFLIEASKKYFVIVYKDKSGKLHKTHTFEKSEAEARLAELEAQNNEKA